MSAVRERWWVLGFAALLASPACSPSPDEDGPPARDCRGIIWAQPERPGESLRVVGSWDQWQAPGRAMAAQDGGWQALALELPPGEYGYLIVEAGAGRVDEHNPLTRFRAGDELEVSHLEIEDCAGPAVEIDELALDAGGALSVRAQFLTAASGEALAPASVAGDLQVDAADPSTGTIELSTAGLSRGRHSLELRAEDLAGQQASAQLSVFVDPAAPSWSDAILYQVVTDRFRGPGGAWLEPPPNPGARAGGSLGGVQAALEDGYFESLGVTALWISPVYQNPEEARLGTDGRLYEGYHGYWVEDSRKVDDRIGGEAALRELIAAAHERGVAVILDVIPNHVYETNPVFAARREQGWFNEHPSECVCGTPSCPWAGNMQDCWFAPYLPDLRVEHPEAMRFAVDEIAWWVEEYEVDGVRIDAVPMMPRAASRRIAARLRALSSPGDDRLTLGEVFTGPGVAGIDSLRYYLGPQGLDSVFDFPFMWALRALLAGDGGGFVSFDATLDEIDARLDGSGAVLGRMLGNHDTARLLSALVGDGGGDPWEQPASQPQSGEALELHSLALTLQLTLPGMPVIYYGDELGLAGGGDPDSRRVMPDPATLSPQRQELLARARRLGALRRCSPALRSSARHSLHTSADSYAYARTSEDGAIALVLLSRADEPRALSLPGGSVPEGRYRDVLGGGTLDLHAGASVELPPRTAMVLLPEDDPCVPLP